MTWAELTQYVTDKLARPNETYITYVLPNIMNQCIFQIEAYWDWSHQYYEYTYEVDAGENEIVISITDAIFKKVVGNFIYDIVNEREVEYKKFFPQIVTATATPYWFTVSPDGRIFLSGLASEKTTYTVPMRVKRTNYTTHPLLTAYPYLLADYIVAHCKKDFGMEEGIKEIQYQTGQIQKYNLEEKDKTPPIAIFNYGIRRNIYLEDGHTVQR